MAEPPQDTYEGGPEERRKAAIRSIASRGVRVEEKEPAHFAVLENVDAGLEESIKCGAPLPVAIVVDSRYFEGRDDLTHFARYSAEKNIISLNQRSKIFRVGMADAHFFMKRYREIEYTSTGSVMHAIRHELSHCTHWHHDRKSYAINDFEDPSHRELAISQVSRYASEAPPELVAEVRAALLDGRHFSDEVMNLYLHYSGGLTR
ncbi:hypothetical protein [Methanomassiliicoccus luminyensis]|jgi:hypothetical protein|uniref:hypothetical protein n=1 Tax=Methanomassiliicoccus luminyensis TaxID=1080712 RepID=UPI00036A7DBD|nr:hypothetical protein [Methanomassiliicoccus luminyensis]